MTVARRCVSRILVTAALGVLVSAQAAQAQQQPFGPLETEAALSRAGVDQEVVVTGLPDDAPFALQVAPHVVGNLGDALRFCGIDAGREGHDPAAQDGIISAGSEGRVFLARLSGGCAKR